MNANQKQDVLGKIQAEAMTHKVEKSTEEQSLPHYFDMFKNLTISGYFSSEIGMTQARKYLPIPGKFEGCIPYKNGDRPWAT